MKSIDEIEKITVKKGKLIVFEGMDATGKSTQLERISKASATLFEEPMPLFTHQPSGGTQLGQFVYQFTEQAQIASPLARQFLHLASHAEHWHTFIAPALRQRAVFMDRFWWSTFAYGMSNPTLAAFFAKSEWEDIIRSTAEILGRGLSLPSVVFLFTWPHEDDDHNSPELLNLYNVLRDMWEEYHPVVPISGGSPEAVTLEIFMALADLGIADIEEKNE